MPLPEAQALWSSRVQAWMKAALRQIWCHRRDLLLAGLLVGAYGVLAIRYDRATPPFEGVDEPWQLACAMRVIDSVQAFELHETRVGIAPAWRLGRQPPLYGAISRWLVAGLDPSGNWYVPNPFAAPWTDEPTSLNAVLHGSPAYAPSGDVALALDRLRRFSAAAGTATILLSYAIARLLFPRARWRPFLAAALVGLNPFFLATSTQANPYTLVAVWSASAFLTSVIIARGWRTPVAALSLGMACGLAALTSPLGLVSSVLIPLAWLAPAPRPTKQETSAKYALLSLLVFIVCAGWWYLAWALKPLAPVESFAPKISMVGLTTSYLQAWGAFGWLRIRAEPAYLGWMGVVSVATILMGLVGFGNAMWQGRGRQLWNHWRLPLCWGAATSAAALLVTTMEPARAPFAWLLAFPSLALLGISAAQAQLPATWQRSLAFLTLAPLAATAWMAPSSYIAPSYNPPPRITLADVPLDIRDVAIAFDDKLYLLGYHAPSEADAKDGTFDITLYWICTDQPEHDYVHSLTVISPEGRVLGRTETLPADGTYPTSLWQPAEVIVERYRLNLELAASQPVAASLRVAVRRLADGAPAHATDSHGNDLGSSASIGRIRVSPREPVSPEPQQPESVGFADLVTLVGYDVYPLQPTAGQLWYVTLHWRVDHLVVGDWIVFVHLVDAQGNLIAQGDSQPLDGALPTPFWRPGDRLLDRHVLPIPGRLPEGPLYLHVGFYQLDTGERLPVSKPDDSSDPNYAKIGPFSPLAGDASP